MEFDPDTNQPLPRLLEPAGFWWRALAFWLDGMVVCLATGLLSLLGVGPLGIIVGWLYYAVMETSRWQATLGKRAVGLIVVTENYETLTFARASGRYFGKILSAFILNIGFIMAAFTEKKQALHDIIAKTLVVKVR